MSYFNLFKILLIGLLLMALLGFEIPKNERIELNISYLNVILDFLPKKKCSNFCLISKFEREEELKRIYFDSIVTMPIFSGCEDIEGENHAKRRCSDQKIQTYIYSQIVYPELAKQEGVEGIVIVRFTIDKKGWLQNPKIIRDIGGGCGEEVLRVINLIKALPIAWIPATKNEEVIDVDLNIPIRFRLDGIY